MKRFYLVLLALAVIGLTTAVFAAPPDPGQPVPQGFQKHHGFHKFGPHLNLTQEQREKMKEIGKRFRADIHDLKYDVRIKGLEVRKLFTDPKTDDATLLAKEKELNGLKVKLMDKKAEMKVEWRKILTPEQIRVLDRMHRHHRWHRHHGRHHRWHRHHNDRGPMGKGSRQRPERAKGNDIGR
ncbi:MAG: Spy/CpxP family protein refolding chaperone [Syntrophorhabdales bacterium]|jgi:Spy/CpxP family protein refolding chaperone